MDVGRYDAIVVGGGPGGYTALDELERQELSTALVTLCVPGGQGIVTIIERV